MATGSAGPTQAPPPPDKSFCAGSADKTLGRMARSHALECWFLTGPTASGKTAVGVELARRIGAEIISMDSMALYRGMDILTAKPSAQQRREVPHHLIDVLEPHEEFSLAEYLAAAARVVEEIQSRGRAVLFVGGTPLYLKGLLRGVFEGPAADWEFRRKLEREARCGPPGLLHRRLAEVDPVAAQRLHPHDTRRIIRALEVHAQTGKPISAFQRQFEVGLPAEQCRVFVLDWPHEQLRQRIDRRVEEMFAGGLVEEVRRLAEAGGWAGPLPDKNHPPPPPAGTAPPQVTTPSSQPRSLPPSRTTVPDRPSEHDVGRALSRTARQALGYREVLEYLGGSRSLAETIALVKTRTRQFAKRQRTWFRSLSECRMVSVSGEEGAAEIAQRIADLGLAVGPKRPD